MNVFSKSKIFLALNLLLFIFATGISASAAPAISSPTPGSTLTSTSVTFTGGHSSQDTGHWLYVGTSVGASNLYDSGSMTGTSHSRTVSGLPTSGTIHVRWYSLNNGAWAKQDHTYTMSAGGSGGESGSFPPAMSSPSPGATLTSSSVTFTGGHSSQDLEHWLYVGTSVGGANLHNSGSMGTGHSRTVSGLPTSGTIHVRWYTRNSSGWSKQDHTYTMSAGGGGSTGSSSNPYFVSTSGNDANPGTQSAPFRTIQFALGKLVAGDTLFIRGGTYTETLMSWAGTKFPSGTSWNNPVKIMAYNGETVNFKGKIDMSLASPAIQYLIFDRIRFDANGQETGIAITGNAHHIRFQNGEVKNADRWGLFLSYHNAQSFGNTSHEFINMDVHHNGSSNNVDHGFYIKTSGNLIDRCNIHDNAAWGIHNFVQSSDPKANNNTFRNNRIHHNGIALGQGGGITLGSGDNNTAYNNMVWKNQTGIVVASYRSPQNSQVHHNTIYDNVWQGLIVENGALDTDVFNNISYQHPTNIIAGGTRTTIGYNLTTNPSFMNASTGDFHLQAGSAAIDTGTTVSAVTIDIDDQNRPRGIRPDIGADER